MVYWKIFNQFLDFCTRTGAEIGALIRNVGSEK